ncbi:MAG: hypothetical protein Q7R95_05925 [bacterium]|nr:hypothetical protein [bacterium]
MLEKIEQQLDSLARLPLSSCMAMSILARMEIAKHAFETHPRRKSSRSLSQSGLHNIVDTTKLLNACPIPTLSEIKDHYEMTQTLIRQTIISRMMTQLSDGRAYDANELASLVDNYSIGLFVKSTPLAIAEKGITEAARPQDIKDVMSYILPRFVNSEHFDCLNNAEIHFTDDPYMFYQNPEDKFNPNNRSRTYSLRKDKKGKYHITFLLRHNIKENYTDAFELMSFMGFIETARAYAKKHPQCSIGETVQNLAKANTGMILRKGICPLAKPKDVIKEKTKTPAAMKDVANKIKKELKIKNIDSPKHVMFGNDFSVTLLIATGVITPEEFEEIRKEAKKEAKITNKPLKIVSEQELRGLKREDDKLIMRQFSSLQYLNRYTGNNELMKQLQTRLEDAVSTVRKRIIQPTHTALGSYVDVIDFTNLGNHIINHIDNVKIRNIVKGLKKKKFKYYSLPYPLGDSIDGLVRAFKNQFGITNFGFFGKVGAVPVEGSKVQRGRIVIPSDTMEMSMQQNEDGSVDGINAFNNILKPKDAIIISDADPHKTVVSVNGLSLQTLEDLPRLKKLIKKRFGDIEYADLLLDMEAHYFNRICTDLGIVPAAIYYVSDLTREKTPDPYSDSKNGSNHTIVQSLGAEGTLASVISPFTILNKWLQMHN